MVAFRRILVAALATVLFAGACTSINIPTIPPINLPSIPPINVPGFTIPPINIPGLPTGGIGGIPGLPSGLDIPPVAIPTGTVPCTLVTAAEVGQIWGAPVTDTSDSGTTCTFISSNFATVSVEATSDTDLSGTSFLVGNTGQQVTVGGFPAIQGSFIGQALLYVQKPSGQLQVLGILTGTDPATFTKLQQIATIAVGRMP